MTVIQLTAEEVGKLQGVEVMPNNFFNPIQDAKGRWIISVEERDQCDIEWVKQCPEIEYEPIEVNLPI